MRRQVLGGGHRHETHAEVASERSQVSDFPNSGGGVILGGTVGEGEGGEIGGVITVTWPHYSSTFNLIFKNSLCDEELPAGLLLQKKSLCLHKPFPSAYTSNL